MPPTKAYLAILEPMPGGAELDRLTFTYNPKDLSYTKSASWARHDARSAQEAAPPEFTGAQPIKLDVEILLDYYEYGEDISSKIELLTSCCCPLPSTLASNKPSAPWVLFAWGSQTPLTGLVDSVAVKCSLFDSEGNPLRATCTVSIEEIGAQYARQNPTSGSRSEIGSHLVVEGDTLASIAYRHLGSPTAWRVLAEVNGIDDPLSIPVGTRLLIPDSQTSPLPNRGPSLSP